MRSLFDRFEYSGTWWLPESPRKKVCGTLSYSPQAGIQLKLLGSINPSPEPKDIFKPEIILGLTTGNERITLLNCFQMNLRQSGPEFKISESEFSIDTAFLGFHFKSPVKIHFKRLKIKYQYLDEWVNLSGIKHLHDESHNITITYDSPPKISNNISDNLKVNIEFEAGFSYGQTRTTIETSSKLVLETLEESLFPEFEDHMRKFETFLCLATARAIYPQSIAGETEIYYFTINNERIFSPIEIFFKLVDVPNISEKILPFDMIFTRNDISENLESYLKNWFEKSDNLEPIINLYFGTMYFPHTYLEHHCLSLAQAIESYHRRNYKGKYLSDQEYFCEVYPVLNASMRRDVDPDFLKSLLKKLEYLHEYSFQKRLKELFKTFSECIPDNFGNKKQFINDIVATRNYLTHYDKTMESKYQHLEDKLFVLSEKLRILVQIALMHEMGIPHKKIKSIVRLRSWITI